MLMSKSRLEKFLYALYSLDSSDLPTPLSRIEELYECLVTGDEAPTFEPLSRVEKYLMAILGVYNVEELPLPLSRVEVLLYKLATGDYNLDDVKSFLSEHEELLAEIIRNGGAGGNIDIEYVLYTLSTGYSTLYNTAEKPIKSAILKGQTLVNLLPNKGKQRVSVSGNRIVKYPLPHTLKKNTKYLVYYNVEDISNPSGSNSLQISMYSKDVNVADFIDSIDKTGLRKYIFTTSDKDFEQPSVWFFIFNGETTEAIFDEVMILEYQDGMENWDIPYFEGMQSVKMPVLTTLNEDGTKTNTLTVNEDVTLRSNGSVYDELDLLTGKLTQRIDENGEVLSQEIVKTVDLSVVDQDGNDTKLSTFNDITHVTLSSEGLTPEAELEVATKNEEDLKDSVVYTAHTLSEEFNTLYNTAKKPVKSAILKGKTLVNINRPITRNNNMKVENGLQILTTWTTAYNLWMVNDITLFKTNTKYYIIAEVIDNTLTSTWNPIIGSKDSVFSGSISSLNFASKETGIKCATFTTKSDFTNVNCGLRSATGTNETVGSILKFRVAIIEYQDDMENWDIPYFEGMQSVKMPVLKTVGKNLFDINGELKTTRATYSINGDSLIITGDWFAYQNVNLEPNTTYTLSCQSVKSESGYFKLGVYYNNLSTPLIAEKNMKKLTFTTPRSFNDISVLFYAEEGNETNTTTYTNIQLEKNSVATTYEPYKSNILTVNEDVELRGIGDVKDELDLMTGKLTKRIGEFVLDGTENENGYIVFNTVLTNTIRFRYRVSEQGISNVICKCDKMMSQVGYNLDYEHVYINENDIWFFIEKTKLTANTASAAKTYLISNPITVQYPLKEKSIKTVDLSVVDQDGNSTKLSTFNDITHVTLSSEGLIPEAELEVAEKVTEVAVSMLAISREQEVIDTATNEQSENVDSTMIATTEIYEGLL